ncbi:MAG: alkaline shock response membrane anchor protein AmaP [Clostridia bacterium]|nr:alkaline shock response membrane anchor protein AmaP [Clostridia bacterium]
MKVLERLALILFSIIILVIAVVLGLVIMDVVELKTIYKFLEEVFENQTASRIILGSCVVAILLAIKALFFPTTIKKRQEIKSGVLLENQDGRLLISKDTIENLTNSVVKSFDQAVDVQTKINLDVDNNITVYVSLLVKEDSIIKELSSNMQNKIKDTIKRSTDLNVNQVNINIKDIENNKNKSVKANNQTKINANNIQVNTKEIDTNDDKKAESVE